MFSKGLKWGAHMLDFLSKSIWTVQVKVWLVPCDVKVTVYYGFMYIRIVKHELTREWWDGGGFPFPLQLGLSEVFSASLFLKRLTCKAGGYIDLVCFCLFRYSQLTIISKGCPATHWAQLVMGVVPFLFVVAFLFVCL